MSFNVELIFVTSMPRTFQMGSKSLHISEHTVQNDSEVDSILLRNNCVSAELDSASCGRVLLDDGTIMNVTYPPPCVVSHSQEISSSSRELVTSMSSSCGVFCKSSPPRIIHSKSEFGVREDVKKCVSSNSFFVGWGEKDVYVLCLKRKRTDQPKRLEIPKDHFVLDVVLLPPYELHVICMTYNSHKVIHFVFSTSLENFLCLSRTHEIEVKEKVFAGSISPDVSEIVLFSNDGTVGWVWRPGKLLEKKEFSEKIRNNRLQIAKTISWHPSGLFFSVSFESGLMYFLNRALDFVPLIARNGSYLYSISFPSSPIMEFARTTGFVVCNRGPLLFLSFGIPQNLDLRMWSRMMIMSCSDNNSLFSFFQTLPKDNKKQKWKFVESAVEYLLDSESVEGLRQWWENGFHFLRRFPVLARKSVKLFLSRNHIEDAFWLAAKFQEVLLWKEIRNHAVCVLRDPGIASLARSHLVKCGALDEERMVERTNALFAATENGCNEDISLAVRLEDKGDYLAAAKVYKEFGGEDVLCAHLIQMNAAKE